MQAGDAAVMHCGHHVLHTELHTEGAVLTYTLDVYAMQSISDSVT